MRISLDEPEKPIEKTEDSIEREAIKKTWKGEKKKLAGMPLGQKVKYIIGYYKWPILGILTAVILISYLTYIFATRKTQTLMGIVINDAGVNNEKYCECLAGYIGLEKNQSTELLDDIILSGAGNTGLNTSRNVSGSTQIMCYVAARELDYAFTDEAGLKYLGSNELCLNLKEFLPSDIYTAFESRIVPIKGGTLEGPRAIDMTGSRLAKSLGLGASPVYLCFQNISGHPDEMNKFLKFLYEFEFGDGSITF